MRSIYGTFMQARTNFSTIKGPAGFELTIILTSNLLHSQSNSFVGVVWCALVWKITVASKNEYSILNDERTSIEICISSTQNVTR